MIEKQNEIREKYLKPYQDNNMKIPKEAWHLIKLEIDKLRVHGK